MVGGGCSNEGEVKMCHLYSQIWKNFGQSELQNGEKKEQGLYQANGSSVSGMAHLTLSVPY
jgi:hypothetical protein